MDVDVGFCTATSFRLERQSLLSETKGIKRREHCSSIKSVHPSKKYKTLCLQLYHSFAGSSQAPQRNQSTSISSPLNKISFSGCGEKERKKAASKDPSAQLPLIPPFPISPYVNKSRGRIGRLKTLSIRFFLLLQVLFWTPLLLGRSRERLRATSRAPSVIRSGVRSSSYAVVVAVMRAGSFSAH